VPGNPIVPMIAATTKKTQHQWFGFIVVVAFLDGTSAVIVMCRGTARGRAVVLGGLDDGGDELHDLGGKPLRQHCVHLVDHNVPHLRGGGVGGDGKNGQTIKRGGRIPMTLSLNKRIGCIDPFLVSQCLHNYVPHPNTMQLNPFGSIPRWGGHPDTVSHPGLHERGQTSER